MKVILNNDVKYLGEEGDVKVVAAGYARNYLLPRGLVVRYNTQTAALFEAKKAEIEKRKEIKRQNARTLKERLEDSPFDIPMSAAQNGKLYAAVTTTIVSNALNARGFDIEKKKIELPKGVIKSVGTYHATIKLYEAETAKITFIVKANITEEEKEEAASKERRGDKTSDSKKDASKEEEKEEKKEAPFAEVEDKEGGE